MKTIRNAEVTERSYYFLLDFNEKDEWKYIQDNFNTKSLRDLDKGQYEQLLRYAFEMELLKECIQCDKVKETHELCIDCLANIVKDNNRISIFKLQKLIDYKNKLSKDSEMYYAFASANFDEIEESKELALSNKLSQIVKDLNVIIDDLQLSYI